MPDLFANAAQLNKGSGSTKLVDSFKERVALFNDIAAKAAKDGEKDVVKITLKGTTKTSVNTASLDLSKLDPEKLKALNIDLAKLQEMAKGDGILTSREVLDRYGDFQNTVKNGMKFSDIALGAQAPVRPPPQAEAPVRPLQTASQEPAPKPEKTAKPAPPKPVATTASTSVKNTDKVDYKDVKAMAERYGLKLANRPGEKIDPSRFIFTTYDIAAAKDKGVYAEEAQKKTKDGSPLSVVVKGGSYAKVEDFMNEFRKTYLPKDADGNPERFSTIAVNSHGGTDGWLGDSEGRINWNLFPSIQDDKGDDASALLKQSKHIYLAGCEVLSQIDDKDYDVIQAALKKSGTVMTANATYSETKDKMTNDGGGNSFTLTGDAIIKNPGAGDERTAENFEVGGLKYKKRLGGQTDTLGQRWAEGGYKTATVR